MLRGEGIGVSVGSDAEKDATRYDLAILSPGIEESVPLVTNVTSKGTLLIGEMELAFTLTKVPVVAITGTNGKTTTTELLEHCLRTAGQRVLAAGNIGVALCEAARRSRDRQQFRDGGAAQEAFRRQISLNM